MGRGKVPAPDSGKDLRREGRLDAFCRWLLGEKLGTTWLLWVPWSCLCCEALLTFSSRARCLFLLFFSGMGRCSVIVSPPDSPSSPPPLPAPPFTECHVPTALTLGGLFVCILGGKAAYICVLRAKSLFLLIPACPLEMFVSKHWIFIVGLLVGNLERIKSFKREQRLVCFFLKTIILLLCQPSGAVIYMEVVL